MARKSKKKQREEQKKKVAEGIDKLSQRVNMNDAVNTIGFFGLAYVMKEISFNPLQNIFALGKAFEGVTNPFEIFTKDDANDAMAMLPSVPGIGGPAEVAKGNEIVGKLAGIPFEIGERIAKEIKGDFEVAEKKTEEKKEKITLEHDGSLADLQKKLEAADKRLEAENRSILDKEVMKVEFVSWMVGFASAYALKLFLSETTMTEIVDALDTFTPFT